MTTPYLDDPVHPPALWPGLRSAALRSVWRWPVVALLVAAGAVHLPVLPEHLAEAPYIGVLFIAPAVACFVLAAALAVRDNPAVWTLAGLVTGLAFAAYVLSRTTGLPQIGDDVGNWTEPLGVAALATEGISLLVSTAVLVHHARRRMH